MNSANSFGRHPDTVPASAASALLAAVSDCVWLVDRQGCILQANGAASERLGSGDDIVGQPIWTLHPPEFEEEVRSFFEALGTGGSNRHRLPLLGQSRTLLAAETRALACVWQGIAAYWVVSRLVDPFQERLEKIAVATPGVFFCMRARPDGTYELPYVSARIQDLYGVSAKALAESRGLLQTLEHPDDRRRIELALRESARSLNPFHEEWRIHHPLKGERWIETDAMPEREPGGAARWHGFMQDVTARKRGDESQREAMLRMDELQQFNQQLQETADRLELATDAADIGVWEWRIPEDRLIWDDRMCALYGIQPGNSGFVFATWASALHPDDRERAEHTFQEAMLAQNDVRAEFRIVRPDGTVRHIAALTRIQRDQAGRPLRMVGVNSDISQRVEAEQNLEEQTKRWQLAVESHDMGVWDWNIPTGEVLFSPRVPAMLGYREGDWSNDIEEWKSRIHPDDFDALFRRLDDHFAGRTSRYVMEHRLRCPDGSYRWILDCGKVIERDASGHPVRMIGTHTDIEDQKQAERKQQRLVAIVEASSDLIATADLNGKITYINPAGRAMVGLPADDALLQAFIPDFHPPWAADLVLREGIPHAAAHGAWLGDTVVRRRDGSEFAVSQSILVEKTPQGDITGAATICRDITERKQAEAELVQARDQAETANRAKSAFLATMSHELRTPLNAILGLTHVLARNSAEVDLKRQIDRIAEAAEHLLTILNDVLDISRIETGKLSLEPTDFGLGQVLGSIDSLTSEQAKAKGLTWTLECDPELPARLHGDPLRLRQVLLNLTSNALKFTEHGSVSLRARCVEKSPTAVRIRFEIADTGIGIAPEHLGRLFEAFEPGDASRTRRHGGTGLGLAICKRITELMGGEIGLETEPGRGSLFWFTVPLAMGSAEAGFEPEAPAAWDSCLPPDSDFQLLLVEDNELNRHVLLEILRNEPVRVDIARNGLEAVERAREAHYDLVLMDIQMPVMDGLEASRRIRQLPGWQSRPILALTANAFGEDRAACLAAGMNEHLAKPVTPARLCNALRRWLPRRPADTDSDTAQPLSDEHGKGDVAATELPQISGLDTAAGLAYLGNRLPAYLGMLRLFADRCSGDMDKLNSALAQNDVDTARRLAHTLKGSAALLGATELRPLAAQLEAALRQGGAEGEIRQLAAATMQSYRDLAGALSAALPPAEH